MTKASSRLPTRFLRILRTHYHLSCSILIGIAAYFLLTDYLPREADLLVAWNITTVTYMVSMLFAMARVKPTLAVMRERAEYYDEGKGLVLFLATVTATLSLAAIINDMIAVKDTAHPLPHMALVVVTVICSWLFMHFIFALHYAHQYYDHDKGGLCAGVAFPGDDNIPDYWDFLYFSYIIGTSAQTADVSIDRRPLRRVALIHCIIAFFFNTTVLALTINAAAGLLS